MARISKNKEKRLADLVVGRFHKAEEFQKPYFERFMKYYRVYRQEYDDQIQNYDGRANLYIPEGYSTIETIVPRLVGSKPKIEVVPREPKDLDNSRAVTEVVDWVWDLMKMKPLLKSWVRQGLTYGVGFMKLTWDFKFRGDEVLSDKPKAELVDIFDIFVDPDASTIDDADYVIHRTYQRLEDLKKNPNYKIPSGLVAEVTDSEYKLEREAVMGVTKPDDREKDLTEVFEYWGLSDLDGNGHQVPALIVTANGYLIRSEKNPFQHQRKPFIKFDDTDIPKEFWSMGEIEPILSLQYELNDVRNQRMDNVTLILQRMWKVAKGADVDEEDLVSRPGGIVHVGDMNGVEPFDTPDVTTSAYNEETLIKTDIQRASGVTDISQGIGSGQHIAGQGAVGNDTATGLMLLQEAGNARFKYKLDNLEDSLVEFGEQLVALLQQFMDQDIIIRVIGDTGPKWQTVTPDNIKGRFDLKIEAGSTQPMNKSVRRAEARELVATLAPFVQYGVNLKWLIEYLARTYDITDVSQLPPQQQQAAGEPGIPGQNPAQTGQGPTGAALGGNTGTQRDNAVRKLSNPTPGAGGKTATPRPAA